MSVRSILRICRCGVPLLALALLAQKTATREAYRAAYRAWRQAEPNLESDASTASPALATRANHAATEAAAFGTARAAFLRQFAEDQGQNVLWLQNAKPGKLPDFAPAADLRRLVAVETGNVNTTINTFAGDADRGIQQLRQALERERTALAALDSAITDRQKAQEKIAQAEGSFGPAGAKALSEYQNITDMLLTPSAALVDQETAAWAKYYPALTSAAASPVSGGAAASISTSAGNPVAGPRAANLPPLPLVRYTGVWVYPTTNGHFFGAEPEFVDFTVHEENGHVMGAFYARFKLPPGASGDPVLRFDFSGEFQPTPRQSFALMTAEGAKGAIELIPGNAFNLIEINFQTDPAPGKVRAADLVLVKK